MKKKILGFALVASLLSSVLTSCVVRGGRYHHGDHGGPDHGGNHRGY